MHLRSPNDVAEVAVRVLLDPRDHYNKAYSLTGPGPVKDQEVAGILSKRLGKPIMYVDQPFHVLRDELKHHQGDPEWMVEDLVALEKVKASGDEERLSFVSGDVANICGHQPQTFEEYLEGTEMMTDVELGHNLVVTAE